MDLTLLFQQTTGSCHHKIQNRTLLPNPLFSYEQIIIIYDICHTDLSVQHIVQDCTKYCDIRNNLAIPPNMEKALKKKKNHFIFNWNSTHKEILTV
jgi:hypothetical protein